MPTIPHTFATYPAGNFPAADWDANWSFVASLTNIWCVASGTNSITLTPASTSPAVTAYQTGMVFTFVAAATNTGAVTIQVGALAALNVYSGGVVLTAGIIQIANYYSAVYDLSLNGGIGGFRLVPPLQAFLQSGTGAVGRSIYSKMADIYSVKDFGAVGDGSTDDSTAIQNCINAVIAKGGGSVYFPACSSFYKTTTQILIDLSAVATRFLSRIWLVGDGPGRSCIKNITLASAIVKYSGSASSIESVFLIDGLRITGNQVVGSICLQITKAAYAKISNSIIEVGDYGLDCTDVDQFEIENTQFTSSLQNIRGNAASSVTSANSWSFFNVTIGGAVNYGMQITNCNALNYVGGSIQYNGTIGGGAGMFGVKLIDCGDGYGTVKFSGMIFEGNGGAGDFISSQASGKINCTFDTVAWARTYSGGSLGYGTNQIAISGAGTNMSYKITNCNFYGYAPYSANPARPAIANTAANARVEIDGLTTFWSTVEAPTTGTVYWGNAGTFSGLARVDGATSGNITLQPQAAAGTYNWNWPITVGSSGTPLLSAGGGASAMTWGAFTFPGSVTSGGIPYFSSTSVMSSSALLTQFGIVYGGGAGATPVATAAGTTGQILVATTSSAPSWSATPTIGTSILVGAITTNISALAVYHKATDRNVYFDTAPSFTTGVAFGSINDNNNGFQPLEIRSNVTGFTLGPVTYSTSTLTLANGLNSNISLPTTSRARITGPTGGFSIGGFNSVAGLAAPTDGLRLHLYNSTAQQMTIVNEDGSSTAALRIKTLTGGNVVLRAGTSFATLSYDATDSRWVLESTN